MPSEPVQLLIAGYVLGDLAPAEAAEFERLLARDPAIAAEVSRMQQALEIAYGSPDTAPPAHLRSAILAQLDSGPPPAPIPVGRWRSRRRSLSWTQLWGAAAAALIVALGVSNLRLHQTLQSLPPAIPTEGALTYALNGTEVGSIASAQVVVNPATLEATLTVRQLPPLPSGQIYALWTVLEPGAPFTTDAKGAILTEVFQTDAQGQFSQTLPVPEVYRTDGVAKVAITVEDAAAPQRHQGQPILITGS